MVYALLKDWRTMPGFASHPIWSKAFRWFEEASNAAADGYHQVGLNGFLARVMEYPLKSRDEARYEAHRHTIDIQYTIQGAEGIEISPVQSLSSRNDYALEKDVEHFETPARGLAVVENRSGMFTVLFPEDAHMPQLLIPGCTEVKKVVIKIPMSLVMDRS
jgi:biofilm protein TabA